MTQQFLTNYSVVVLKYSQPEAPYYLANQSFVRSEVFMSQSLLESTFQNFLFYVELSGGNVNQTKSSIQFQQNIVLRHKISNRYLSYSSDFEDEENDTTVKLQLSHSPTNFRVLPCFQYQTKISNKVKFNEDVFLATQLSSAKLGYLSVRNSDVPNRMRTIVGLNLRSKINFNCYFERDRQQTGYVYGTGIWLTHIQSNTFLTTVHPNQKQSQFNHRDASKEIVQGGQKQTILFEKIKPQQRLQSINGLWLIQSVKTQTGGRVYFNEAFRLKSLCTGRYLGFGRNYKLVQNERVYSVVLQQRPDQLNKFVFQSLKGQQNRIMRGSYLIFKHQESGQYIGTRKVNQSSDLLPFNNYSQFQDQDLFEIKELDEQAQQAIRFIFSIRRQFLYIQQCFQSNRPFDHRLLAQIQNLYDNIILELKKLQHNPQLFQQVQEELGPLIPYLIQQLRQLRQLPLQKDQQVQSLLQRVYSILTVVCHNYKDNQFVAYQQLAVFATDIFADRGAQLLIAEIFKNNYSLLCKLPLVVDGLKCNIVQAMFSVIVQGSRGQKSQKYWNKIRKIYDLLEVLLTFNGARIDINQRLISSALFDQHFFDQLFIQVKTLNQRIRIMHPHTKKWLQIQQVKQPQIKLIVQMQFSLFSKLCENRNFISKRFIHAYLNEHTKNGIQVLISYLNVPISQQLSNHLFSFLTNCYIDSAPRLIRHKPLAVLKFVFKTTQLNSQSSKISEEQAMIGDRLKDALLGNAQQSYATRPMDGLTLDQKAVNQPTMNSRQLAFYKQEVSEKIRENVWSADLLGSICILMRQESYTVDQLQQIKQLLDKKVIEGNIQIDILSRAMQIYQELATYCLQGQLKKITCYLRYLFNNKHQTIGQSEAKYFLDLSKPLPVPLFSIDNRVSRQKQLQNERKANLIQAYNKQLQILGKFRPSVQLKQRLMELFVANQKGSFSILSSLFSVLHRFHNPKLQLMKLLNSVIIVTNDDITVFENLFNLYKKLKHLCCISEHWLTRLANPSDQYKQFSQIVRQLTDYLFDDAGLGQAASRKSAHMNINHQLLLKNLAIHRIMLDLLEKNFYLLEGRSRKEVPKLQREVFEQCLEFLYYFALGCKQNITILMSQIQILYQFRALCEVGQTRLFILMYSQQPSLIKEVRSSMIEVMLNQILKQNQGQSRSVCEYNPQLVQLLRVVCQLNGQFYKRNGQYLYKLLLQQNVLRRFLFMQEKKDQMCLDLLKFKAQPLQLPYIYHKEALCLVVYLIQHLETSGSFLKQALKKNLSMNYMFQLMAAPDIYSHNGLMSELYFLLKKQIVKILHVYLQKQDSLVHLYQNEFLSNMLDTFTAIFAGQLQKKIVQIQNQYLMLPYLQKHKKTINTARNNVRDYFTLQIHPLLVKLYSIFDKATGNQKNKIYLKLQWLLQKVRPQDLTQDHLMQQGEIGMNKISLKWRNFVDNDQDNSPEQKFAKKTVLQLLRSQPAHQQKQKQQHQYHQFIYKRQQDYVRVIATLIKKASQEENRLGESHQSLTTFNHIISNLAQYLVWRMKHHGQEKRRWAEIELVQTLIGYITGQTFNYNKPLSRRNVYEILRVFNVLLQKDEENALLKLLYKIFNQNFACYKFFNCLRKALQQVSLRMQGRKYYQQVGSALNALWVCGQQQKISIDKVSLKFITLLCRHQPFTELLRNQPYQSSIDFLDKIYNSFSFMVSKANSGSGKINGPGQKLNVTVFIVDISEVILQCMQAMLNGCNQDNQNFLIDNKFTDIAVKLLKMQAIRDDKDKLQIIKRDRLFQQVCEFYQSNGIDLRPILQQKVKMIDFQGLYLLNRFKHCVFRLLIQCILANQRTANKVRIMVPLQLLKINLIWLYEQYKAEKVSYNQTTILRAKLPWEEVIKDQKVSATFLGIGFLLFHLIELGNQTQKVAQQQQDVEVTNDHQKNKEKVVKHFFSSISQKQKNTQKQKALQTQPFAQQMLVFYQKYYEAYQFFQKNTLSIQAQIFGNLVKLYFPRLPLCDQLTPKFQEKLVQQAQRISHDQKLKSLMQFQDETYLILQGERDYLADMQKNYPITSMLLRLVRQEDNAFLLIWILSCLITLFYLIEDYNNPNNIFTQALGQAFSLQDWPAIIIMILVFINLVIGLLLLLNLVIKKIPLLSDLNEKAYLQTNMSQNKILFKIKNIIKVVFFDIYVIVFVALTVMHSLFAGFLLVYIVKRISLGRQIVQAIQQTWFSLFVATALLIVFNYFFSIFIYSFSYTDDVGYGVPCQSVFRCVLLLVDQSLKSGSGFLGVVTPNYQNNIFDFKFLSEITYILFAQKVIFEIFSGTIIDKFSQLRQKSQGTEQDQASNCYICGQERFQIDFQLQGFQQHIDTTHNKLNYIFYMFYLRRKKPADYGIQQSFVWKSHQKDDNRWIPDQTSLLKLQKQKQKDDEELGDRLPRHEQYYQKKHQELKKVRMKLENLTNQLKEENSQ